MTEHSYLIALLPLLSFVLIVFFLRWNEKLSAGVSIAAILSSWAMSVMVLIEQLSAHGQAYEMFYKFVEFTRFAPEIGILIDPLAAVMLVVVTTVGACVQIYSIGYMHGDPRFSRFFSYLSLFLFSMLGLVLANNFFMIFIFWELVGLTSYLLIGFWFEKASAANACKKAFLTTRVGDLGFLVGLFLLAVYAGTFNYGEVFDSVAAGMIPTGILTAAAIFIFCGAVGKSAQFPLHVWLPDAMEGPTPVSALIHAATMVAAGVYLVARSMSVFVGSAEASMVVAVIGLVTSFMAGSIALVQNDIKRVLAYSTCSQLGYMIMALGLYGYDTAVGEHSPGFYAGTFHLMTHAFFKGLLFLGAGSVIHAVHTNDIQKMGGLLGKLKITGPTFIIASLSIAGIFPLSGFWSKDEIVAASSHHPIFFVFTLLIAFMTAFYMFRLCFLTFYGEPRDKERFDNAHESPKVMTYPLVFLAFLSIFAGWVGIPWIKHGFASFVSHGEGYHPHANYLLMVVSTIVAASGIGLAYLVYYKKSISADSLAERFKPLHTLLYNKYYFDELYELILLRPTMAFGRLMWRFDAGIIDGLVNGAARFTIVWSDIKMWFDKWIVDGAVNGSGWIVRQGADILRFFQTGHVQFYTFFAMLLIVLLAFVKLEMGSPDREGGLPLLSILLTVGIIFLAALSRSIGQQASAAETKEKEPA
ncbi:MAG: NADH-quinone oxidoreductase subunit L [candidate division Zixibacteria bacterium]|nr:NADH-quinone oxidoreductase subunit L [candidate division Zixibacteria bacterium]MDH3935694.1 NADH-quinone oxidoreductase subunit L [candidate division Zixibacteria bacterium]MDH4033905.1 NADH-quinone oxidoreductase subunit L [candidate division Zixibacteria bacterium]